MSYDMRQRDNAEARYDTEPRDDTDLRDDTELRNDPDLREEAPGVDSADTREAEVREAELREDEAELREGETVGASGEADADRHPDEPGAEPYRDPDTGIYRSAEATPAETAGTGTPSAAMPSAATPSAATPSTESLWPETESSGFQARWREVQLRFVDDPRGAAEEAEALAGEVIGRFTAAVTDRKRELDAWRDNAEAADTEQMRMAVRQYRQLLDRVFGV